jgi:hypothetical protein
MSPHTLHNEDVAEKEGKAAKLDMSYEDAVRLMLSTPPPKRKKKAAKKKADK